jgi:iron-sulfur cluster repair protein YtfE (RIC family)
MDAIGILKEDHKVVKKLLGELERMTERAAKQRGELLMKIERELKIHTHIEEQVFYPEYRDAVEKRKDQKLFFEAREEHVVDRILDELKQTDPESLVFAAKAKVLREVVEHHIERGRTRCSR